MTNSTTGVRNVAIFHKELLERPIEITPAEPPTTFALASSQARALPRKMLPRMATTIPSASLQVGASPSTQLASACRQHAARTPWDLLQVTPNP